MRFGVVACSVLMQWSHLNEKETSILSSQTVICLNMVQLGVETEPLPPKKIKGLQWWSEAHLLFFI